MKYFKWQQICSLITCFLVILVVAINRDQQAFGKTMQESRKKGGEQTNISYTESDGTLVVSTKELAKDVMGYGGNIPLKVYIKEGRITRIVILKNSETPDFLQKVEDDILPKWIGVSTKDALKMKVDAVSGATLSSRAFIETVRRALSYAQGVKVTSSVKKSEIFDLPLIGMLLVVVAGGVLPFFIRSSRYRIVQLVLNIVVLGFWSGSFISYSLLINYVSNGINLWTSIVPVLLLVIAFIYPLFGKKNHYCTWLCPFGSLQELIGKVVTHKKISIKPRTLKYLGYFREGLWALLMLLMLGGIYFQWADYELFAAFMFHEASLVIVLLAVAFLLLSSVVMRPYCRFVCPTGTLVRISQNMR